MKKRISIDPFSIIAFLVILVSIQVYVNVYFIKHVYPIFTTEDQIDATKQQEFGFLANYI